MAKPEIVLKLEAPNGKAKELPPIQMNELKLFEQCNAVWRVVMPAGVSSDDLENPALWTVVGTKIRPFDRIEAIGHAATFWAELLILSAEKGFPTTARVLRIVEFASMPKNEYSDLPAGYGISYDPTSNQYTPVRSHDNAPMAAPQQSREAARTALVNHAIFRK